MLSAVIFDMDGVIVDSEPLYLARNRRMFKELGIAVPPGDEERFVGLPDTAMWEYLHGKHGLAMSVEQLTAWSKRLYLTMAEHQGLNAVPGAIECIRRLHGQGVGLALASSSSIEEIEAVMTRFGLHAFFEHRVSADQVARGKPAPDLFLRTASLMQAVPAACVVIADSANGIRAARAAGMPVAGFVNPHSPYQDLSDADLVFADFAELTLPRLAALVQ
jgi:HAD superfamily hydrolase (TIGR01509 family)